MQPAKLAGKWAISGYQAGKGPIFGQMTVSADPSSPDGFNVETHYVIARTGEAVNARRQGGRLHRLPVARPRRRAGQRQTSWREVMFVERDWREMSGRWFTGGYDEIGIDVTLDAPWRASRWCSASDLAALKTASTAQAVKIYGANLPATIKPEDIDFGPGVKVDARRQRDAGRARRRGGRRRERADRSARSVRGRRGQAGGARRLRRDRRHQGAARRPGMARVGGVGLPEAAPAVRGDRLRTTAPTASPTPRTNRTRDGRRDVVDRGVHRHVRRRRHEVCRRAGRQSGLFTPNVDGPNPQAQRATGTTSATSGSSPS